MLEIRVIDNGNTPISNAVVSVAKISYTGIYNESAEGIVIEELYTDNNGIIKIELPVLNELMGSTDYYSANIFKDGYYSSYIFYIQIYPNINSSYEVYLTPRTEGEERFRFFFQPKKRTVHEH
jgi:hypothetical protein